MDNPLHLNSNSNSYSIINILESKSWSWIFIADHRHPWRSALSWTTFFLLTFVVPLFSHFGFQRPVYHPNYFRPFDWIVQVSLTLLSTLSFVSLWRFTRKYGLRRFLFLDKLDSVGGKVRQRYSQEVHVCFSAFLYIMLLLYICFFLLLPLYFRFRSSC